MRQNFIVLFLVVTASFVLNGGCALKIREYQVSAKNVKSLKEMHYQSDVNIKVGNFTPNESGTKLLSCRLSNGISPPTGYTFESYIVDAIISEMQFARIYSEDSIISLNINFEKIDFDSSRKSWIIIADLSTANNNSFRIESEYNWPEYSFAEGYCVKVSEFFPDAVRKFISEIISSPKFGQIIRNK